MGNNLDNNPVKLDEKKVDDFLDLLAKIFV